MSADATRATDPRVSAWVSANAGAGKTYLLTDRVTRLLYAGALPSRILCLTYTKAAAAEMATRLFGRLGDWALLSDADLTQRLAAIGTETPTDEDLRRARRLFAQALETPGGLKIQTIHSFCQHLLARFPVEAGIPPRFHVLDERSAGQLMADARETVLERASRGERHLADAVAILATRAADGRFADILDLAVGDSGKLRALIAHHGGDEQTFFAYLRRTLDLNEDETENEILSRFCAELSGERAPCERIAKWLLGGRASDVAAGQNLMAFLDGGMSPPVIDSLSSLLMTKDGPRQRLATKLLTDAEPELHAYLNALQGRFVFMAEKRKAAITAQTTEALVTVVLAVLESYDESKRASAALDYDDLILSALRLLERADAAAWVLYKLDGGIDHILVDEAQDTSLEQWKIVARLTEEFFSSAGVRDNGGPRTLFAVGDEKQSIFSFQGADPASFGTNRALFKMRVEGAGLAFASLFPAVSRRSGIAVLNFVDELFANDAARDGLTVSGDSIRHDPFRTTAPGRVEIWPAIAAPRAPDHHPWDQPVDAPPAHNAAVILASRIAERISGWLKDGTTLPGANQPIRPGDIMILVRRRNAFTDEMIRQLIERGVPVAGADRMVLIEQIAIADLVALGRFALLPADDLTLAALLKSPLIGFSEDDLFDLAHGRAGSLWQALAAKKDARAIFTQAHEFLGHTLAQADFVPPFEFYARILSKGVRRKVLARLGAEAADAMDEFLSLALMHESTHPPSLEAFLAWFEKGASEVKRDMDEGAGHVRVMTVHGAKGLEANIVILPDTAQVPDHERHAGLLYTDDCVYFAGAKASDTAPVTAAKAAARMREMREYRRLLYVAATRAREWLIVTGYETRGGVHPESWYPHVTAAGKRIGAAEIIGDETVITLGAPLSGGVAAVKPAAQMTAPLPAFLSQPAAAETVQSVLRPFEAADESAVLSPGRDDARFVRGRLVHALLARLPDAPPEAREDIARRYLAARGLSGAQATQLIGETLSVLNHPDFAPLFGPGSRAEVVVAGALPELGRNARISGQIDRLAVTDDAVLIADFKTNRPPPTDPAHTPSVYLGQMALYRAVLRKIYPGKRIDCALIWTVGTRLMALPDALLDAELEKIAQTRAAHAP